MCALFPVAMDASERKEWSLCIPEVSLSHSQERREVRSFGVGLRPGTRGHPDEPFLCVGDIARREGGIAPLDNTELGISTRLAGPAAARGRASEVSGPGRVEDRRRRPSPGCLPSTFPRGVPADPE